MIPTTIRIKDILILQRDFGTDIVFLHVDLPYPYVFKERGDGGLTLQFDTTKGTAKEYVERHFPGIPTKVIDN